MMVGERPSSVASTKTHTYLPAYLLMKEGRNCKQVVYTSDNTWGVLVCLFTVTPTNHNKKVYKNTFLLMNE
jgi:hypothetical protein